ncbi:MAG: DMT family transporter [Ruthenibacterium sp.]
MFYILAIASGILCAVMVAANGGLATAFGSYSATVLIHVIGLTACSGIVLARRVHLLPRQKIKLLLYMGGVIGVGTTLCNNLAFGAISLSALLALSLLGQTCISLLIDQFGWFDMPRRPMRAAILPGFAFSAIGILCMVWPLHADSLYAVLLAVATGVCIVLSRTINASLSENLSIWGSTWWNFATGLIFSLCLLLLIGRSEPLFSGLSTLPPWFCWTGGLLGVSLVALTSVAVKHLPAFPVTLCMFVGQLGTGLVLDAVISGSFSLRSFIGCACVGAGILLTQRAGKVHGVKTKIEKKPDPL